MTLEEYKEKIRQNLKIVAGEKKAQQVMKNYEFDFSTIYQENWSVEEITPAILMNLY